MASERHRSSHGARAALAAGIGLVWLAAVPLAAEPGPAEDAAPPPVGLDALLKIPRSTPALEGDGERVAGATRSEWEERFAAARGDVAGARRRLSDAQRKLEKLAQNTNDWQMAAPGAPAGSENSPLSYELRQTIRREREEVERAEKAFEELRVEANLAGVPRAWQEPAEAAR